MTSIIIIRYKINKIRLIFDRGLYETPTKIFRILISFGEVIAYVFSGMYGEINQIGVINCMLLIFQLVFAGIMVMVLDELLSKGYGLSSGISLFIATNISENIVWKSFSPFTVTSDRGVEYEGAVITAVHLLITKKNKIEAIHRAFYRNNAPNLNNLVATIIVFFIVIYFQGFRKEIKIANKRLPGYYITNFIQKIQKFLYNKIIGQWDEREGGQSVPVGGLAYYISPPRDLRDFIIEPVHSIIYVIFILLTCGLFSKTWVELSGKSGRDFAKKLRDNQYFLEDIRQNEENVYKQLNRTIPAATIQVECVLIQTIFADFIGAIGSGTGILLVVTIIYEYFEELKKMKVKKN